MMSHYLFKKFIAPTKHVDLVSSSSTLENRKWSSLPSAVQQWPAQLKTKLILLRYSDNMCWPGGEALCFNPIIILCRINDWIPFLPSTCCIQVGVSISLSRHLGINDVYFGRNTWYRHFIRIENFGQTRAVW